MRMIPPKMVTESSCLAPILLSCVIVTKLSLDAFTKALESKDKIDPEDKMIILQGIEEALKILFPNCVLQG